MLLEMDAGKEYSHIIIRNGLNKYNDAAARDKAFIKRVAEGTIERRIQIDYILNLYSNVPVSRMKPLIRNLLRMSVYQILWMDTTPDAAVCNEAVKLAQAHRFQNLKGFVNGVLRTVVREKESIPYPDKSDMLRFLSVMYSMPEWIVAMWREEYGDAALETMLSAMLESSPVVIRMDETRPPQERAQCVESMRKSGITVTEHPWLSYAYTLAGTEGIGNIPEFAKGMFAVQDVSSMLAVQAAGIREHDRVLDVCAAPGGKAVHAACRLRGTGHVLARDIGDSKIELIRENIARFGYDNITAQAWDACVLDETLTETADVVIADLPCSGLGVTGRKSDVKYRVTKETLDSLVLLQKRILGTVWRYVKPGGILLYSTCTIHKAENEAMVQWIREKLPLEPVSLQAFLPKELQSGTAEQGYVQLLPGIHKTDGFFIAKFRRLV